MTQTAKNTFIGKKVWDGECVCWVHCSLCHPVSGTDRNVWTVVYGSSCWERRGDWLDAAWPGRASLIKGLKLISMWFHMVGCLLSSSLLSDFHSSSLNINWYANEATTLASIWSLARSLHPLIHLSSPSIFHCIVSSIIASSTCPHPFSSASLSFLRPSFSLPCTSVSIWMGSEQQRHKENEAGSSLYTRFPLYQPHYGTSGP